MLRLSKKILDEELTVFVGYKPTLKVENTTNNRIKAIEENRIGRIGEEKDRKEEYHYGVENAVTD